MNTLTTSLVFICVLFSQLAQARSWDKIKIPGAVCGDGRPYSVFYDNKKSDNLLIEFMGGGACWSNESCFGLSPDLRTWFHPIPEVPAFSYMTTDTWGWSTHPFRHDSALYFPYCTGDVFAGNHVADYEGRKAHHKGYQNVVLALEYLKNQKIIPFEKVQRLTVWGASAGAIGSLVHMKRIEGYFPTTTKKIGIIDSAGLHFGKDFWKKFTPELATDFHRAFLEVGLDTPLDDGFIAPFMGPVFESLSTWHLGFLQSTRDFVMSETFGDISKDDHEKLVLSDRGLPAIAKGYPNVRTWISDSAMHTFLLLKTTSWMDDIENNSAISFVNSVVDEADKSRR